MTEKYSTNAEEPRLPLGKPCTACREWKLLEEFCRAKKGKYGKKATCKACDRAWRQANGQYVAGLHRRWYQKNKEDQREKQRQRRQGQQKEMAEYQRRYREANRDRLLLAKRTWYEENKERTAENVRRWQQENSDKVAVYRARVRAKRQKAEGSYSAQEFATLCEAYGNMCLCCGSTERLTADHVVPLSKGGSNGIENIQVLCMSCNARKGAKTIDYR